MNTFQFRTRKILCNSYYSAPVNQIFCSCICITTLDLWNDCRFVGFNLVSHWRFLDNHCQNTSVDVSKMKIYSYHILLKPLLGGMDGSLHLPLPFMNRLNQIEPATFCIFVVGLSLGVLFCLFFFAYLLTNITKSSISFYWYLHTK